MLEKLKATTIENYFEYALYLLLASLFFGNAALSIAYVIFLASSLPIIFRKFKFKDFIKQPVLTTPCLFFLINLFVLLYVKANFNEILKLEKLFPLIIFPVIFFSARNILSQNHVKLNLCFVFLLSAFINLLLCLIYGIYRMFFHETNINSIYITYNHLAELFNVQPIYLSLFYLLAIIMCTELYIKLKTRKQIFVIIGALLFVGIILLSSRSSLVISVIMVTLKLFKVNNFKRKKILLISAFLFLGAIIIFSVPILKNRIANINQNVSSYSGASFRMKIWKNTIEISEESPLFGYGYKKSQKVLLEQYKKVNFRRAYISNYNAHNQYLQTLIDSGVIALMLLIVMIFLPLLYFQKNTLTYNLFSSIIIIAIFTESFFYRQYGVIFFILFHCYFFISQSRTNRNNSLNN